MNVLLLILCLVFSVEFFLRFNVITKLKSFKNYFRKIGKILFSKKVSNQAKSHMFKKYSIELLKKTSIISLLTLTIMFPFLLFIILDYHFQFKFLQLLSSTKGIVLSIIIVLIYEKLRNYVFK